ncbi:putative RecA/RadA family phage recombinase [Rhodovulum imhoffii]|uniref:Putative RecA/RadA family phage recombinase n=1 Tax=Rhodovulum imhoffii TaxID=365340 RepID=A0A2T5BVW1_9RHOB|nr:capsid cement protein [Rhodovulum imhoffii]MBK5933179.1 hypothetical protein [Rhodovulum imhoffii]PTN03719.1 putative RecA/RadA family phage recombinase [Rhodovulum imhoffii]
MRNYVQPGDTITIPAPGPVLSGQIVTVGALTGIASGNAEIGENVALSVAGVFDLPKVDAEALALGDEVEVSGGEVTALASGSRLGVVIADAAANDATARVRLTG